MIKLESTLESTILLCLLTQYLFMLFLLFLSFWRSSTLSLTLMCFFHAVEVQSDIAASVALLDWVRLLQWVFAMDHYELATSKLCSFSVTILPACFIFTCSYQMTYRPDVYCHCMAGVVEDLRSMLFFTQVITSFSECVTLCHIHEVYQEPLARTIMIFTVMLDHIGPSNITMHPICFMQFSQGLKNVLQHAE